MSACDCERGRGRERKRKRMRERGRKREGEEERGGGGEEREREENWGVGARCYTPGCCVGACWSGPCTVFKRLGDLHFKMVWMVFVKIQ